jgi:hypothetical protein
MSKGLTHKKREFEVSYGCNSSSEIGRINERSAEEYLVILNKGTGEWMDSKRKVNQVFNDNILGSRLRVRPKNRWWNCVQTDINKCKITNLIEITNKMQPCSRIYYSNVS